MGIKEYQNRPTAISGKYELEGVGLDSEISILGNVKLIGGLDSPIAIKRLWVFGVNDKQLALILEKLSPQELIIEECRIRELSILESLPNIQVLVLQYNTKAGKLWDLSKNRKLSYLHIEDFPKVVNIGEISKCKNISTLILEGGRWKDMKIESLEAVSELRGIKKLRLMKLTVKTGSISALRKLSSLEQLELSNDFDTKEYACLSTYLPTTNCERFSAYRKVDVLKNNQLVYDIEITGKGKPFLNSESDSEKLNHYIKEFERLQSSC